jgi:predicted amidohydrolase YtcJ
MFFRMGGGLLCAAAFLSAAAFGADGASAPSESHPAADLIVRNAHIWTVNPKQPQADALAVLNGRFVAVGSQAPVMPWQGPHTRIVDARGKRLLPGGVIVRDASGEPTGALKDAATELLQKAEPSLNLAQRRRAVQSALQEAAKRGVTSIQDMSLDYGDLAVYSQMLADGKLTVRVYGAPLIANVEDQAKLGLGHAFGGPSLRIGALKMFADGSLGSRTAYFTEPYTDEPGNRGLLFSDMLPLIKAGERLMRADAANLQVCTHAIGDAGIKTTLDLYQAVDNEDGPRDRRWRIEHAQHMASADFERFAQLHVIASVQPYQAIDDGRWAETRIGHDRATRRMPSGPSCSTA